MRVFISVVVAGIFLFAGFAFSLTHWLQKGLPSVQKLESIEPSTKTQVFDVHGHLVHEFFKENRSMVPLDKVPANLKNAIIAVEDRRFYKHWGVDIIGVGRAFLADVVSGQMAQGASTITQQLARNLFLTHERTFQRKLKEAIIALRIERTYSKDEILEMYCNQIYFGDGAYGVDAASRVFFEKDVSRLTLPECALLAGLPRNPRDYSPRRNPEIALKRRAIALKAMLSTGAIGKDEYEKAMKAPLGVSKYKLNLELAPYFVEMVRLYLDERYGSNLVYEGGLKVYTSLDATLQEYAEKALEEGLVQLETRNKYPVTRAGHSRRAAANGKRLDASTEYVQGSLVAMDPKNGHILALIGGRDFEDSNWNRAVQAARQPGSAFKPFIYTAALDNGFKPSDVIEDSPVSFQGAGGKTWTPSNYSRNFRGPVSLRYALQHSINIPAIKLLRKVGISTVVDYARRMGVQSSLGDNLSLALGTSEVTMLELCTAFSTLADQGIRSEPIFVLRVEDKQGNVLEKNRPRSEEVLSKETASIMTSMLQSVVDHGTGYPARAQGFYYPAAGKTGTTDDFTDAWFIGYTPELLAAAWVGFDKKITLGSHMTGAEAALPIWTRFMIEATRNTPATGFPMSEEMVSKVLCADSGFLAGEGCPRKISEIFKKGTEPAEYCTIHNPVPPRHPL
ncbi:MAG: PBP1A family penicillin-binding protein [Candidatus Eisenbacteria bacterium]|nr:PBP1A family penicillin-binding protein [Candidatus Eisenbacteria bacterium]